MAKIGGLKVVSLFISLAVWGLAGWLTAIAGDGSVLGRFKFRLQFLTIWPTDQVAKAEYLRRRGALRIGAEVGLRDRDGAIEWL